MSLTRSSSFRNASSATFAAFSPQAARSASRSEAARSVPRVGQLDRTRRARDESVDRELVEDRFDRRRVGQDRIGDAGQQRKSLDRDDAQAPVGGDRSGRRRRAVRRRQGVGGRVLGQGAGADIDAEFRRPGEERSGLRDHLGRAGDHAGEDLAGPPVDRDHLARHEDPLADHDAIGRDVHGGRTRPPPGSPIRARRPRRGWRGHHEPSGCRLPRPCHGRRPAMSRTERGSRHDRRPRRTARLRDW